MATGNGNAEATGSESPGELAARCVGDLTAYMLSQALGFVAQLGIADAIGDEPRPVDDVAAATGVNPDALYRTLRALASRGYFTEVRPRVFAHTALSELLRDGASGSLRHYAIWLAGDSFRAWAEFDHTLRTGKPAFEAVFGAPLFDYLTAHAASGELFNKAMAGTVVARLEVVATQDWSNVGTIVDVGGGRGGLVISVLARYPTMRGVVFDLPNVVVEAERELVAAGVSDRSEAVGGDFFVDVPAGGDLYVLAQILHDWSDDEAVAILRTCRRATPDDARLVLLEQVVPPGDEPGFVKLLDLQMMVLLTGRERTQEEWRDLLRAGGFELGRIEHGVRASLFEARPA